MGVRERWCVCVCVCERGRQKDSASVRGRQKYGVSVSESETERDERESLCVREGESEKWLLLNRGEEKMCGRECVIRVKVI